MQSTCEDYNKQYPLIQLKIYYLVGFLKNLLQMTPNRADLLKYCYVFISVQPPIHTGSERAT